MGPVRNHDRSRAVTAERGSACQAGEPGRRVAAAVRAPRRELPRGDIEDGGQPLDFPGGETPLLATRGDADTLLCRLIIQADLGVFTLAFAPWPAALVLRCPLTALPAQRRLSVRDVRLTTRMGRTVR